MGNQEIERKFLIERVPFEIISRMNRARMEKIIQGYLPEDRPNVERRLRKKGDRYFFTTKNGSGLKRGELETEISAEVFQRFWPKTERRRIEKKRYVIKDGINVLELDLYSGTLFGLIVVECEFPSEEMALGFKPLSWFGREITEDKGYKNRNLALYGMPRG